MSSDKMSIFKFPIAELIRTKFCHCFENDHHASEPKECNKSVAQSQSSILQSSILNETPTRRDTNDCVGNEQEPSPTPNFRNTEDMETGMSLLNSLSFFNESLRAQCILFSSKTSSKYAFQHLWMSRWIELEFWILITCIFHVGNRNGVLNYLKFKLQDIFQYAFHFYDKKWLKLIPVKVLQLKTFPELLRHH